MMKPKLEMQRLAAKFALLFFGCYVIVVFGTAVGAANGASVPALAVPLFAIPLAAFVPSVLLAVRMHRTTDDDFLTNVWWKCLGLAALGLAFTFAAGFIVGKIGGQ